MPARLARTLTVYAVTPLDACSRYQPTNCPVGTNVIAITANSGTMTASASNVPGRLVGRTACPRCALPYLLLAFAEAPPRFAAEGLGRALILGSRSEPGWARS